MYKSLKAKETEMVKEMVTVMVKGTVDLGYNPSDLFVFCKMSPYLGPGDGESATYPAVQPLLFWIFL